MKIQAKANNIKITIETKNDDLGIEEWLDLFKAILLAASFPASLVERIKLED